MRYGTEPKTSSEGETDARAVSEDLYEQVKAEVQKEGYEVQSIRCRRGVLPKFSSPVPFKQHPRSGLPAINLCADDADELRNLDVVFVLEEL